MISELAGKPKLIEYIKPGDKTSLARGCKNYPDLLQTHSDEHDYTGRKPSDKIIATPSCCLYS
ncbi:MAG: hypothetical protein IH598_09355 [Bacteroidales bacterium]|nr:hypothetical protein [Bacteroidales bacterium]